jgi:hypothetical protein
VFQFESRGMQGMLRDARPTRLEDLIALNALYRPGPMDLIPDFIPVLGYLDDVILLPVLIPIARAFEWDLTWFGVILTMKIAIGQFTPPMAVNLMVSCRIAGVTMESTIPWVVWMILAMFVALALVVGFPGIALWLPRVMGMM